MTDKKAVFLIGCALSPGITAHSEALYDRGEILYDAGYKGIGTCITAFVTENKYYPHALFTAGHCLEYGAAVYGRWGSGIFLGKILTYKEYNDDVDVVVLSGEAVTGGKFWSEKTGGLTPVTWRIEEPSYGQ